MSLHTAKIGYYKSRWLATYINGCNNSIWNISLINRYQMTRVANNPFSRQLNVALLTILSYSHITKHRAVTHHWLPIITHSVIRSLKMITISTKQLWTFIPVLLQFFHQLLRSPIDTIDNFLQVLLFRWSQSKIQSFQVIQVQQSRTIAAPVFPPKSKMFLINCIKRETLKKNKEQMLYQINDLTTALTL